MSHEDATRARFSATAAQLAALSEERVGPVRARLKRFVWPRGDERALDVGTGAGTLALALAPLVREVVGVDLVPELLEHARRAGAGVGNLSFVEGDALALPFEDGAFDLVATSRTLHHVARPEVALAEMTRVTRLHGRLLVVDQIASLDPLEALAQNRLERLRDASHARALSDQDFRGLFEANWLVLLRSTIERDDVDLDTFLDRAGCSRERRQAVVAEVERLLSSGRTAGIDLRRADGGYALTHRVAWYLTRREAPDPTEL